MNRSTDHDGAAGSHGNLLATAWGFRAAGALLSGVILLAGLCGFHMLSQLRQSLQDQCQSATALLQRADDLQARYAQLQQQLQLAAARRSQAIARVPATADETEFLKQLAGIARQTQLDIRDYRPGRVSQWPTHSEVELAVRAEGSYRSLCHFLAALGNLPRICRVSQLTVSAPDRPDQPSAIDFQIALTYALASEKQASRGRDQTL